MATIINSSDIYLVNAKIEIVHEIDLNFWYWHIFRIQLYATSE